MNDSVNYGYRYTHTSHGRKTKRIRADGRCGMVTREKTSGRRLTFGPQKKQRRPASQRSLARWFFVLLCLTALFYFAETMLWWSYYPISHVRATRAYADEYELDPFLLAAVVRVESGYDRWAVSSKGARGLMQVMPETGYWAAGIMGIADFHPDHLFEPDINLRIGTWYLAYLLREFDGNEAAALAAYNSGLSRVRGWMEGGNWDGNLDAVDGIPYPETREFVRKVTRYAETYRRVYRRVLAFRKLRAAALDGVL
jgi:soluble lytic murein transglycosylase